jgi:hypothetical protein
MVVEQCSKTRELAVVQQLLAVAKQQGNTVRRKIRVQLEHMAD